MMKYHTIAQYLINQKRLTYTTTSIHSDELWPTAFITSIQLRYLLFSSNDCTHTLKILIECGKYTSII